MYKRQTFKRPAFQQLLQDISAGKIECVVVKDLSRIGRDHITVGYYIEEFFPLKNVRFVSVTDQFDTVNGCLLYTSLGKIVFSDSRYEAV